MNSTIGKIKKLIYIVLLFFIIIQTNTIVSKAAGETFDIELSIEDKYITKGTQFEVLISISNLSTQEGLTYVGGNLEYDSNILTYVSGSEKFITEEGYIEELSTVEISEVNSGHSIIDIYYLDAKVRNLKMTFEVNKNTTALQTKIALKDFIGTNVDNQNISATAQNSELTLNIYTPATQVTLNKTSTTLYVGQRETLEATILPENATENTITWSSSDEKVATVDQNGRITGIKVGTATITATIPNSEISASCEVKVIAEPSDNNSQDDNEGNNGNTQISGDEQNNNNSQTSGDEQNNNNNNNSQISGEEQNNNSSTTGKKEDDDSVSNQKLPYTGSSIMIILIITITLILAVISFKKTRDLRGIK